MHRLPLHEAVLAELRSAKCLEGASITVMVEGELVVLTGLAVSYPQKYQIEHAAKKTGARAIVSKIRTPLDESPYVGKADDTDIARQALRALDRNSSLPAGTVRVLVEHGRLTLSGRVSGLHERLWAFDELKALDGVTGVSNGLVVQQPAAPH